MFVRRISSKKFQWVKEEYWSIRELIFYGCRARLGWNLPYNYKRARPELHDVWVTISVIAHAGFVTSTANEIQDYKGLALA